MQKSFSVRELAREPLVVAILGDDVTVAGATSPCCSNDPHERVTTPQLRC
jgi:hypothetical protein